MRRELWGTPLFKEDEDEAGRLRLPVRLLVRPSSSRIVSVQAAAAAVAALQVRRAILSESVWETVQTLDKSHDGGDAAAGVAAPSLAT